MKLREYTPGKSQPAHQIEDESKYKHGSIYKMDPRKIIDTARSSIKAPDSPDEWANWTNPFHPIEALPGLPRHLAPAIVLGNSANKIASRMTKMLGDMDRFGDSFKGEPKEAFDAVMDLYMHWQKVFMPFGTVQIGRRKDGVPYFQIMPFDTKKGGQTLLNPYEIFYGRSMGSSMEVPLVKLADMGLDKQSGLYENKNLQENKVRKLIRKVLKEEVLKENASILAKSKAWVEKTFDKNNKYKVDDYNDYIAVIEAWKKFVAKGYDLSALVKNEEGIHHSWPSPFENAHEHKWIIAGKPRVKKGRMKLGGPGYYLNPLKDLMHNEQKDFVKSLGFEQHPDKDKKHFFTVSPKYKGKIDRDSYVDGKYTHPSYMFNNSPTLKETIELIDLAGDPNGDLLYTSDYHQKVCLKLILTGTIK